MDPAPERPYSEGVHPFHWRNFWDYGSGTLGDFGCHYLDLVHWALKLHGPRKIAAQGPAVDAENVPLWVTAQYDYPARGSDPAVRVHWYDGGKLPPMLGDWLKTARTADGKPLSWPSGQMFLGEKGMLVSNYGEYRLLPSDKFADFKPPADDFRFDRPPQRMGASDQVRRRDDLQLPLFRRIDRSSNAWRRRLPQRSDAGVERRRPQSHELPIRTIADPQRVP